MYCTVVKQLILNYLITTKNNKTNDQIENVLRKQNKHNHKLYLKLGNRIYPLNTTYQQIKPHTDNPQWIDNKI